MTRLTDTAFKAELLKELNNPDGVGHSKTNFYELLRTSYSIEKARALKLHTQFYSEWAALHEAGMNKGIEHGAAEAAQKGLKSKTERMLSIQRAIEEMEAQLNGEAQFYFMVGNQLQGSHKDDGTFTLPVERQLEIRGKIKEYTAELNKMCGDYAPAKTEVQLTQTPTIILPGSE